MLRAGLILTTLMFAPLSWSQTQQKNYTLTLTDPSQPMRLEVDVHVGSVNVIGYDGKEVEITADFTPLSEQELAKERQQQRRSHDYSNRQQNELSDEKPKRSTTGLKPVANALFNLEIEEADNVVEIESTASTYSVALQVRVPKTSSAELQLYRGRLAEVDGLSGALEIKTWQGTIVANNISGPIVAETHQFDIEVNFSSLSEAAPSSLTTYAGDIDVTLQKAVKSNINVKNFKGDILSGLDTEFVPTETVEREQQGNKQHIVIGGQMSAKVNGGGQVLGLNTYSGNVYVRKGQ